MGFPGVAKARVLDTNDCTGIPACAAFAFDPPAAHITCGAAGRRYYNVHIAIAPEGGGIASPLLKQELTAFLEARKVVTVEFELYDPVYRSIDIDADMYLWAGEAEDTVRARIERGSPLCGEGKRQKDEGRMKMKIVVTRLSSSFCIQPSRSVLLNCGEIPTLGQVQLRLRRAS